jgi:UTP--glucose-1-phosphate uridylyltransferase
MPNHKVKGVIVGAGYGTRFLPVTKTIPKEMIPLVDRPAIDFIIEEFVEAGIEEVAFISSRRKKAVEDYFDREFELDWFLRDRNAFDLLPTIKAAPMMVASIRQDDMRGTGHAILQARPVVSDGPFVVAYPDDVFIGGRSFSKVLIDAYKKTGKSVLGVVEAGPEIARLSSIEYDGERPILNVKRVVEKPAPGTEPSNIASVGRYLFTPELFDLLEQGWKRHKGPGEFFHTDAINTMAARGHVCAVFPEGKRLDVGTPETYIEAFVEYALFEPRWRPIMLEAIERVMTTNSALKNHK